VDETHLQVLSCDLLDDNGLAELNLRYTLDDRMSLQSETNSKISRYMQEFDRLSQLQEKLMADRRRYMHDIVTEDQAIIKYKSKFNEISHQFEIFQRGMEILSRKSSLDQMRSVFQDLTRINGSVQDKLMSSVYARQLHVRGIKQIMSEIQARCSAVKRHISLDSIPVTLPKVAGTSAPLLDKDLMVSLVASRGHFAPEIIMDLSEKSSSSEGGDIVTEEITFVGVLATQCAKYKSISRMLMNTISDANTCYESTIGAVDREIVIKTFCVKILKRLECGYVVYWANKGEGWEGRLFSRNPDTSDITSSCLTYAGPMEEVTAAIAYDPENLPTGLEWLKLLPADILNGVIQLVGAWTVDAEGIVAVDSGSPPFAASPLPSIYCEQMLRHMMSVLSPLELATKQAVSRNRPVTVLDCLFELRDRSRSVKSLFELAKKHMSQLMLASNLELFIPIDHTHGTIVRIGENGAQDRPIDSSLLDYSTIPLAERETTSNGDLPLISIVEVSEEISPVLQSNREYCFETAELQLTRLFPVSEGRIVTLVAKWSEEATDEPRDTKTRKRILSAYLGTVSNMLSTWTRKINSNIGGGNKLVCYETQNMILYDLVKTFTGK
jgi:hypothetical protein